MQGEAPCYNPLAGDITNTTTSMIQSLRCGMWNLCESPSLSFLICFLLMPLFGKWFCEKVGLKIFCVSLTCQEVSKWCDLYIHFLVTVEKSDWQDYAKQWWERVIFSTGESSKSYRRYWAKAEPCPWPPNFTESYRITPKVVNKLTLLSSIHITLNVSTWNTTTSQTYCNSSQKGII